VKFAIERSVLLKAMLLADSVVEARTTIPVLSNVMLKAHGNRLRLTSTDLDIAIEQAVPATVETGGGITVNSATLAGIVRKLPDGAAISCELADNRLVVKAGRSRFALQTLPCEDFPDFAAGNDGTGFVMPAKAFHRLMSGPLFSASTEEIRYYLNGVYLHHRPAHGDLAACATNGHHLGLYWDDLPAGADAIPGVIVPRKTCALLAKHLDGVDGDAAIRVSASRVVVKWGEISIASKLIDGTFPDYERVIPRGNQLVAEISTSVIRAAVDRVTAVTGDKTRAVKLVLTANAISLVVDNPDGAASDEIDVVYAGPEVFIGFNAKYLTSTVAALEDGNVRMALANAGSPAVFTPANGGKCLAVIMPMRV